MIWRKTKTVRLRLFKVFDDKRYSSWRELNTILRYSVKSVWATESSKESWVETSWELRRVCILVDQWFEMLASPDTSSVVGTDPYGLGCLLTSDQKSKNLRDVKASAIYMRHMKVVVSITFALACCSPCLIEDTRRGRGRTCLTSHIVLEICPIFEIPSNTAPASNAWPIQRTCGVWQTRNKLITTLWLRTSQCW